MPYVYQPLADGEIRVLILLPGNFEDPLQGKIEHIFIHALSSCPRAGNEMAQFHEQSDDSTTRSSMEIQEDSYSSQPARESADLSHPSPYLVDDRD